MNSAPAPAARPIPPAAWRFPQPYGLRTVAVLIIVVLVLWQTGRRVEMDRMVELSAQGIMASIGLRNDSQVGKGFASVGRQLWPLQIAERTETSRIENFDRTRLPLFSHLAVIRNETSHLSPVTLQMESAWEEKEFLIEPFGYLQHVALKMLETIEIALWGTVLAVLLGLPLAILGARNLTPHPAVYLIARTTVSLCRAVPELISALFLVLAYGFGPIAGVLALALHAAGFLGKFYAEDIENADTKPQEALRAIGANRLKILRYAILPQVMPQYVAYTLYILDRNVRMAMVIGLVGAGGIGQELKGRYDMYHYGHVGTILVAIFLLVVALDQISARLRRRLL